MLLTDALLLTLSTSSSYVLLFVSSFFFFNDTATTEIYTLSLHDALPICDWRSACERVHARGGQRLAIKPRILVHLEDRKSTRLNSSHEWISYAVFCLKKKKKNTNN